MIATGGEAFAPPRQCCKLSPCDVRTDRKSAGLPERRFRLSHSIIPA
jgi:hypothetical protein